MIDNFSISCLSFDFFVQLMGVFVIENVFNRFRLLCLLVQILNFYLVRQASKYKKI